MKTNEKMKKKKKINLPNRALERNYRELNWGSYL